MRTAALMVLAAIAVGCGDDDAVTDAGMLDGSATDSGANEDAGAFWQLGSEILGNGRAARQAVLVEPDLIAVAGGDEGDLAAMTIDTYDVVDDRWVTAGELRPRTPGHHTVTTLVDGRLLITAGGLGADPHEEPAASAGPECYLYDPMARVTSSAANLLTARSHHAAVRMGDGRVLVVGGAIRVGAPPDTTAMSTASAEVYDPGADAWSAVAPMTIPRWAHSATVLATGEVLVVGGTNEAGDALSSAELYDPATDAWDMVGPLREGRGWHVAARLGSGRVLVVGGFTEGHVGLSSAELFDPSSGSFEDAAPRSVAGGDAAGVALDDQRILVLGGRPGPAGASIGQAAVFDDASGEWTELPPLNVGRSALGAVLLGDGRIVAVMGRSGVGGEYVRSVEVSTRAP